MTNNSTNTVDEKSLPRLESLLSLERFKGLKAILDSLGSSSEALGQGIRRANSYEELLQALGYRVTVTKQIHVADCYSRVGPAGGIKAVLPYHDIPTQSSLPTLVNFDSTVTTTPKSAAFFNQLLTLLKKQLSAQQ